MAADDEERGRHVEAPQHGLDARRPLRVGAVVERQRDAPAGGLLAAGKPSSTQGKKGRCVRERGGRRAALRRAAAARGVLGDPLNRE